MNEIANRENSEDCLRLLRARSQVYRQTRWFQMSQLGLTVVLPLILGLVGVFVPDVRLVAGSLSVIMTIIDVSVLDRQQKSRLKIAAKISEQFDVTVLELPWNAFLGKRVDPEIIQRAATGWPKGDAKLRDWYPPNVSKAPIASGRVLCQRANLRYDCELRRRYGNLLLATAIVIALALIIIGKINHLEFDALILTTLAPAGPILVWAWRERFRQLDTGIADDTMRAGVETLWNDTSTGKITEAESTALARTLQDAIYAHRASSPLIFPFIYDRMRSRLETEMHAGTDDLLRSAGYQ